MGKEGKTKEVVEDREVRQVVCEELCVTKLYVKDGVLQRKMVRKDQQDPARPFCTKQMKDITVRCNHKHCQVPNVTKNLNMTIEMKRRTLQQPML